MPGQAFADAEQPVYQQPGYQGQQPGYQAEQPGYQGAAGQQAAGSGTGAMNAYPTNAGGQPTAFPSSIGNPANGNPANGYAANGHAVNGYPGNGYETSGPAATGGFPGASQPAGTGAFPANGQVDNGYSANGHGVGNGYSPAPGAPQPPAPTFTPTFTPRGPANSAGAQNGHQQNGQPQNGRQGQDRQSAGGYPAAPGYPNGADYQADGAQPSWPEGQAAAQRPGPGYPAGSGQTGPFTADHSSTPGYAPAGQFDPSQQSYWE